MTRAALVTGASSGIGRATVRALLRENMQVAGVARRSERLDELAAEVQQADAFLGIVGDVSQAEAMQAAVEQTLVRFGRLDLLVANAGVGHRGALVDSDWEGLETLLRTNIDGVLHSIRAAVPAMRQSGGGQIIIVSSVTYNMVSPYAASYAASKAFVSSIAHSLRLELEDEGIQVTDLLVGRTATEFDAKRLGLGPRTGASIPTMTAEDVAETIIRVLKQPRPVVTLRWFDRLIIWGNLLLPDFIGRRAKQQYR